MIETERLLIRRFREADVDAIHEMRSDPEVMRYIRETAADREESAKWTEAISAKWESEGIGYCALVEKATGDIAGWCGTWRIQETNEVEVGYAIAKTKWGKGFATEAAAAMVDHAFSELRLDYLVAVAYPENEASIRVMKKLGMSFVREGTFYGKQLVQYSIRIADWQKHLGSAKGNERDRQD
ncbi:MAG: N-acetyltransferase [Acidobacteria bacterium]|nr:MAG: N-acetyltransferase [Acidobacteriota bacterium]REJ98309.1 MAG: N-acetyltransferase [Acidobacteriota bacterium]REK17053.1 MAG: N-acetyltransferase [Acidobacteriota bacterium]REK42963.1 MAG: N-acetyltransferase [Acidobacteriota bacterium]